MRDRRKPRRMRTDIKTLLRSPRNVAILRSRDRSPDSRAGEETLRRPPLPFPDRPDRVVVAAGATCSTFLQNGGAAANAHTVAGQWRHFTAFPSSQVSSLWLLRGRQHALAVKMLFPSVAACRGHNSPHSFVTQGASQSDAKLVIFSHSAMSSTTHTVSAPDPLVSPVSLIQALPRRRPAARAHYRLHDPGQRQWR